MANTFSPFGFRQFGTLEGNTPTYGLTRRSIVSSDTNTYFTGDVVTLSTATGFTGSIALPSSGLNTVNPILGIFAGCEFFSAAVGRTVFSPVFTGNVGSSSPCNAYIIEGEDNLFIAQVATQLTSLGSSITLGTSCIGMNVGFTTAATSAPLSQGAQSGGNLTTGISNIALLVSSALPSPSANSSYPFRIVDTTSNYFPPGTNGADSTVANPVVIVSFNNSLRRSVTGQST